MRNYPNALVGGFHSAFAIPQFYMIIPPSQWINWPVM